VAGRTDIATGTIRNRLIFRPGSASGTYQTPVLRNNQAANPPNTNSHTRNRYGDRRRPGFCLGARKA